MKNRNQKGAALVELVCILPLLLLLLGGIIDFSVLFYNKQVLTNASREAARAGIADIRDPDGTMIFYDQADFDALVGAYCQDRLVTFGNTASLTTNYSIIDGTLYTGTPYYNNYLKVSVQYSYTFLFSSILNWFGANFGPTMDISAQTVMQIERAFPSP